MTERSTLGWVVLTVVYVTAIVLWSGVMLGAGLIIGTGLGGVFGAVVAMLAVVLWLWGTVDLGLGLYEGVNPLASDFQDQIAHHYPDIWPYTSDRPETAVPGVSHVPEDSEATEGQNTAVGQGSETDHSTILERLPSPFEKAGAGTGEGFTHRHYTVLLVLVLLTAGVSGVSLDGDTRPDTAELTAATSPFDADTDSDGLKDGVEATGSTDPVDADTDDDGLEDGRERELGTDPTTADTDGDGVPDGKEVDAGTDPRDPDTDGDGLGDETELNGPTDATKADTDGDGLDDATEVNGPTNPTNLDTDGDGLDDGAEVEIGTDPTIADTDGDGLDDGRERELGTDPTAKDTDNDGLDDRREVRGETDATNPDTDGDGLLDGKEKELGTDPTDADTDADELPDGQELVVGADPTNMDTDSDRIPDGVEVTADTAGAEPTQMDVFVEVDAVGECTLNQAQLNPVQTAFDDAPIVNPNGESGVDLHFVTSERLQEHPGSITADGEGKRGWEHYIDEHQNQSAYYHHLLLVETIDATNFAGLGRPGEMIVECSHPTEAVQSIIMHELGHSLGLTPSDFDGIDSRKYSRTQYPSVMNYNTRASHLRYGRGPEGEWSDWNHLQNCMFAPPNYQYFTNNLYPDCSLGG